ncbi:hypothetical protein BURK2_01428 [Burkholderiales bacterium]|nr:MAG: caspase family protein [Burkholderiales bacterium]CAG0973371.1 hypothetical protein BURK2_01428 [Burkholderiales bacterium]
MSVPRFLLLFAFALLAAGAGAAERRVALVVGNAAYASAPLKNPVNDARAIAQSLQSLGFEVHAHTNLGQKDFNRAITAFGERLTPETVALFYFAGHGVQVRGKNYLVPVDARIANEGAVRSESVDVDALLDQFQTSGSGLNIVILDACRNNPFERSFRGASGGLAQMDAPKGTMIAYATAPGRVALDGEGDHGLYTSALLQAITTPGLKVEDVFKRVRVNVARGTGDQQMPWESSSLTGDFYFASPKPAGEASTTAPTVMAGLASPAATARLTPNAAPTGKALRGIVGIDSEAFFREPRVAERLRTLGVELSLEVLPSRKVPAKVDAKQHDFVFVTGAALAAGIAQSTAARRSFTPFFSPLVLASWQRVAELLEPAGAVKREADGVWYADMRLLARWMNEDKHWKSLPGSERFPSSQPISVVTADPRSSSTAAAYLALHAFLANGDDVPDEAEEVARTIPKLRPLFARQGMREATTVDVFNDYLELGVGARPLVLADEAEYVGRLLRNEFAPTGRVLLYPRPGIFAKRVWLAFSEGAERAGRLLREDPELQRLAGEFGFRAARDAEAPKRWRAKGVTVPEEFLDVVNPPPADKLDQLIEGALGRPAGAADARH